MKKTFLILFCLAVSVCFVHAQCNEYYQLEQNTEWEMQNFNAKDKLTGKVKQKVTSYEKTTDGFKATVHSVTYNDKDKEQTKGDFVFTCSNGIVLLDMRNFITEDQMKPFENFEMKVETENLEYPSKLTAGQSLKDGSVLVTAANAPFPLKISIQITDRKVIGNESITTPAGTFACVKITSLMNVKSIINMQLTTTEWIAPKVGVVRSESYNKNGKYMGYSIMTSRK